MLWNDWWLLVCDLRSACARTRTFLWMALCLAGITTRKELLGVTSIVRALGLEPACYDRLLDFFHSPALDLNKLTLAWCALVFRVHPGILRVNGRPVLVADGIKVAKATTAKEVWPGKGPVVPTSHLHGGAIMGTDASNSVTNSYGQTHEIGNLWMAGPCIFPSEGASNPTYTIFAVSLRGAEQLAKTWGSVAG